MTTADIPFFDADAVRAAVPMADLLDAVEAAYRDVAAGRDHSPLRTHVAVDGGDLLLMAGVRHGGEGISVKLVTVMAANAGRGMPTVQAVVAWFDAATGRPLAFLDGSAVTAMRTGAASGVATRLLARGDAATVAVLGAGGQAEWQVRAVLAARPIRRVLVYARSAAGREAFAARMAAELSDVTVEAVDSAEAAVGAADVICCATTSGTPVFEAEWLPPGVHVNGIGAYRLDMVEMAPRTFERAALVAVDSRAAVMAEAGDVVAAIRQGFVAEDRLVEIGTVARDWAARRPRDAITAFKSVGLAIQDVAAAELIVGSLLG